MLDEWESEQYEVDAAREAALARLRDENDDDEIRRGLDRDYRTHTLEEGEES